METLIGSLGLTFLGLFLLLSYLLRPIKDEYKDEDEFDDNDEFCDMCLTSELDVEIANIAQSLDDYLLNRCFDRAKCMGRKTADVSDLRCIMFELEFDNKILSEIKK